MKKWKYGHTFFISTLIFLSLIYLWRTLASNDSNGEKDKGVLSLKGSIFKNDEEQKVPKFSQNNHLNPQDFQPYIIDVYKKQLDERASYLKRMYSSGYPDMTRKGFIYILMVPEVHCVNRVRIGNVADGGKWMCHPMAIKDKCAIFSLGVQTDISFEEEIQALTNKRCAVHSYDKGNPPKDILDRFPKINGDFTKALISNIDDEKLNTRSIKSELQRFKLDRVEILKIDIEGAELKALPPLLEDVIICQILIEIHATPKEFIDLIVFMASKGYRMFHFEINGLSMDLCEFSFLHDMCLRQFGAIPLAYYWEQLINVTTTD